uniref:RNase H domain-containing protein n=1 Tax=Steinernema glaseri TaxID=37863 RepID=A0A1I7ZTV4_9BILA
MLISSNQSLWIWPSATAAAAADAELHAENDWFLVASSALARARALFGLFEWHKQQVTFVPRSSTINGWVQRNECRASADLAAELSQLRAGRKRSTPDEHARHPGIKRARNVMCDGPLGELRGGSMAFASVIAEGQSSRI